MRSCWRMLLWGVVIAGVTPGGSVLPAQGTSTLVGVVFADTTDQGVGAAEVAIAGLNLTTRTDASGRFTLSGIMAGAFEVTVRKVGFTPATASVSFNGRDTVVYQFSLPRLVQSLAPVKVAGEAEALPAAKLAVFESRRRMGAGRFLTARDLERKPNLRTGDALAALLPGVRMIRPPTPPTAAYVGSSRGVNSIEGKSAFESGSRPPPTTCLVNVWLDGLRVYGGLPGEPPFDVNTLQPSQIAAVEFYGGAASLPSELRSANSACGAIVIWTR